jgi:hypothetical protein
VTAMLPYLLFRDLLVLTYVLISLVSAYSPPKGAGSDKYVP